MPELPDVEIFKRVMDRHGAAVSSRVSWLQTRAAWKAPARPHCSVD